MKHSKQSEVQNRQMSQDIRDSVFTMIRTLNPTTEAALAGLLNVLGAVIAERGTNDPAEIARLRGIVDMTLPQYIHAYRKNNPLTH